MKQNDLSPLTLLKNVKIKYLDLQTYTSTFSPPCSTMERKKHLKLGVGWSFAHLLSHPFPGLLLLSPALQGVIPPKCHSQAPLPPASCYPQSTGRPGETERWENGEAAGESFPALCFTSCRPGPHQATPAMDRISIQLCIDCVPLLSSSSRASSG